MRLFIRTLTLPALLAAAAHCFAAEPNRYVGNAACKDCHQNEFRLFSGNAHSRSAGSENTGCESCHGPGEAHVNAAGGKSTIVAFTALSPAKAAEACLRCHQNEPARANVRTSAHTLNGVACLSCHSIHSAATAKDLLAAPQTKLCYQCHADVRSQFDMPFKHRVNEGVMTCSDCHNPHGTFAPTWGAITRTRMVEQAPANEEACLKCHADKRGPFAYEHPSVRVEGCEMCHAPHGSPNSRLLRRPVVFTMCLECHNGAAPFGLHGTGVPNPTSSHNMTDPRYQNCTACHVRIHGSNSSFFFLR